MSQYSDVIMVFSCFLVSTFVLFLATRSMMESADLKMVLLAAFLMTLANGIQTLAWPSPARWAAVAVIDFIVIKKVLDSTVYFAAIMVAVWLGIQVVFYKYLAASIHGLIGTAATGS